MNLGGFQKMTMLDYPEHIACTIFTTGCNMRCPFCHNSKLAKESYNTISETILFDFLKSRIGLLDAVCISGGEPTLQKDLKLFIQKIKDLGYLVKLDTNGTNPETMIDLIESNLIDYVAMDIKNCSEKYNITCGNNALDFSNIDKSIDYLLSCKIDYEFRTTVLKEYHTESDMIRIAKRLSGCRKYYLQKFVKSSNIFDDRCEELSNATLCKYLDIVKTIIPNAELRGVDVLDTKV